MTDWAMITDDEFKGVPDGKVYPESFKKGDVVFGNLAALAVKFGSAEEGEGEPPSPPPKAQVKAAKSDTGAETSVSDALAKMEEKVRAVEQNMAAIDNLGLLLARLKIPPPVIDKIKSGELTDIDEIDLPTDDELVENFNELQLRANEYEVVIGQMKSVLIALKLPPKNIDNILGGKMTEASLKTLIDKIGK